MRICADAGKGKLRHIRLGNDHAARCAQPSYHCGIRHGRRRISENLGARAGGLANDIEQILDADDNAVEGT